MLKIKICGITRPEDAQAAVDCGADAIGFVFYKESPRSVTAAQARDIIRALPPLIQTVGVFVNETPERIREIVDHTGINVVQLHGDEPQEMCDLWPRVIKSFRIRDVTDLERISKWRSSAYLLDAYAAEAYGGTGQMFNWDIAIEAKQIGRVILAGGLSPVNIEQAVKLVRPYAVDVSSGVERTKGVKDHGKMKEFIRLAKGA